MAVVLVCLAGSRSDGQLCRSCRNRLLAFQPAVDDGTYEGRMSFSALKNRPKLRAAFRALAETLEKMEEQSTTRGSFMCPECRIVYDDAEKLQTHYSAEHVAVVDQNSAMAGQDEGTAQSQIRSLAVALPPCVTACADGSAKTADSIKEDGSSIEKCALKIAEDTEVDELVRSGVLKRQLLNSGGPYDTLRTCMLDVENGSQVPKFQLECSKSQVAVLNESLGAGLSDQHPDTRYAMMGVQDLLADMALGCREDKESLAWFFQTLHSHFQDLESVRSFFSPVKATAPEEPYSNEQTGDLKEGCPSTRVRSLASFIMSEFDFMRAKCRESQMTVEFDEGAQTLLVGLEKENNRLNEKLRTLRQDFETVSREVSQSNLRISALTRELQLETRAKVEATELMESLMKEKQRVEGKLETIQAEYEKSRQSVCELQKLNGEQIVAIAKMEQQLTESTMERDTNVAEIRSLQCSLEAAKQDLANEKQNAESERDRLEASMAAAEQRATLLESSAAELAEQHKADKSMLQRQIDTMTDQLVELRKEALKLRGDVEKSEKDRVAAECQCHDLETELERLKDEAKAAVRRLENVEADYSNKSYEYEELSRKYGEVLGALQEIGLQHSNLQVDVNELLNRQWEDDSLVTNCSCGKAFSVTHHCRNCGNIFCNECSSGVAKVVSCRKPVRVCDACFAKLTGK